MIIRRTTFGVLFFFLATAAMADGPGGAQIEITISDRSELETLTRMVSIDRVDGAVVRASASPQQLADLRAAGIAWQELSETKTTLAATMCALGWEDDTEPAWDCYPSYQQYVGFMQRLAIEHPQLCRLERIGVTNNRVRPHRLLALRISDNPELEEDEPEVLLSSTMHGDETTGFVLMLRLARELLELYGSDSEITALVDEVEIWINPNANPDGTYYAGDHTVGGAIRYFTTDIGGFTYVNPNRNFPDPDPEDGDHPDGNAWWPETRAMMNFAADHSFALSANFHGGIEVVNYPWDTWQRRHTDDAWFYRISRSYADAAQEDGPAGYMTQLDNGVTNGWDWYPISGGRQDFMTYFYGGRELTIELSNTKLLPAAELPTMWTANRRALLGLLAEALSGVRGLVTNSAGTPLEATVEVLGHDIDADRSWVYTDPDVGDFHRLLLPGTYNLRFSAPGYEAHEANGIAVSEGAATVVDVEMQPAAPRRIGGRLP